VVVNNAATANPLVDGASDPADRLVCARPTGRRPLRRRQNAAAQAGPLDLDAHPEAENAFVEALHALEVVLTNSGCVRAAAAAASPLLLHRADGV
jgi:hypothetical protein